MQQTAPEKFDHVSVTCKANLYFDGKVASHTLTLADGSNKTLGLIYPGSYTFTTAAPERMQIVAGRCRARVAGGEWREYPAGHAFEVPADSSFDIEVSAGITEYLCSFG